MVEYGTSISMHIFFLVQIIILMNIVLIPGIVLP